MSIVSVKTRDPASQAAEFQAWLRRREPALAQSVVEELRANPGGSGFSNETLIARVADPQAGQNALREYVVRFGPADPDDALFPDYDIPKQYNVMRALALGSDLPVPPCLWLESSTAIFGSPYFVMERVAGDIPSDDPPYSTTGFLFDADDAERERFWWSSIETIARVGRVDWEAAGLGFLQPSDVAMSPIQNEIQYYEHVYRWGRQNSAEFPLMERAVTWLKAHAPRDEPRRLLWGDARIGNIIYRDFEPVALLDWELAGLGDPESDLAWFLISQSATEKHPFYPERSRPRSPGFPTDAQTIARFEDLTGRKIVNFDYYWAFSAFKFLAIMQRICDLFVRAGLLTPEDAEATKIRGGMMADTLAEIIGR